MCLCKVRDGLKFSQNRIETASDLQESECQWALAVCSVGAVDDALEGDGCLSVCDAGNVPDLLHGGESLRRLVGSQLDHQVESSCYGCAGFDIGNALDLGNSARTLSFAFGKYVAGLITFRHFFLPWRALMLSSIFLKAYPRPFASVTPCPSPRKVSTSHVLDGLRLIELFP